MRAAGREVPSAEDFNSRLARLRDTGGLAMLVEFSVANHKGIAERQTLSMVPNCDDPNWGAAPERAIETGHPEIPHLLPDACILGANGTGKTSLVDAMRTMVYLVNTSADNRADSKIPVTPFALERGWSRRPSEFEAVFLYGPAAYRYGFKATRNRIMEEWLAVLPEESQDWSVLLDRKWNSKDKRHEAACAAMPKGRRPDWLSKTHPNTLLLSAAANAGAEGHLEMAFAWLSEQLCPLNLSSLAACGDPTQLNLHLPQWRDRVVELCGDLGVCLHGIEVSETHMADLITIDDIPSPFREVILQSGKGILDSANEKLRRDSPDSVVMDIQLLRGDGKGGPRHVDLSDESSGIQTIVVLAGLVLEALGTGSVIVADNLSAELHPTAVDRLIEMFCDSFTNPNGAQLVFTTRDPAAGRKAFFERDQVWIMETERDDQGAWLCYELNYKGRKGVGRLVENHLGGGGKRQIL